MLGNLKDYYKLMSEEVAAKILNQRDCFKFAVVADTHLDNSIKDTISNIASVHEAVKYDCAVHLGDFLNGNLPKSCTQNILKKQIDMFRAAVEPLFTVQGNHDGFADMVKTYICNVSEDEDWYEATAFADKYDGVSRTGNKPYFFVDYPIYKIRLIILCTFYYNGSYENGDYVKIYGTDDEQCEWFEKSALNVDSDWTIMIFSHDAPFERFDENVCTDNPRDNGNRLMEAVKSAKAKYGFDMAAWFVGHFHGDFIGKVNGLNFILVASETAYVPQLWDMPKNGYYPERSLGTESEDCWDSVIIDKKQRKVRLFRFGAGKDREIEY